MLTRRKIRLSLVCTLVAGMSVATGLLLYALSTNIDLFYTPGEIAYGKNETHRRPFQGQHLRVGGYVQPGSISRDRRSLAVTFTLIDSRSKVTVSYRGLLPDLFREGQAVVVQGVLDNPLHILATQVLAKHDENYTPPEISKAMAGLPSTTPAHLGGV